MDNLKIPTFTTPIEATIHIPGSKSITNRALLIAALANGKSVLENALFSEDTHWFSHCLQQLSISVEADEAKSLFHVQGTGGIIPSDFADLFVGNAGTAARFITAMVSLGEGTYHVDGIPRMRERPMGEMLLAIERQGSFFDFEEKTGHIPFSLHSHGFKGGNIVLKAYQTSQQLSALLLIAPYAKEDTFIEIEGELVSQSYIAMTCHMMESFGVQVEQKEGNRFFIKAGQCYQPMHYMIEPDASNASYFFAAAAITGGSIRVENLTKNSCQGDTKFVKVLEKMGCHVTEGEDFIQVQGTEKLRGIDVDLNDMSDMVQTLAAIAPFADTPVAIRNVEHIRWKETDRLKAVVTELRRMGVKVEEYADGMRIYPSPPTPTQIETYDDHRMAMSFAVTGLRAPGIVIKDPNCTRKTFPDFFTRFLELIEAE